MNGGNNEKYYMRKLQSLANSENIEAQYALAKNLLSNKNDENDINEALNWLRKASNAGHRFATLDLIQLLLKSNDFKLHSEGFMLAYAAALNHIPDGEYYLGLCFLNGLGTDKNFEFAKKWITQAADEGSKIAMLPLIDILMKDSNEIKRREAFLRAKQLSNNSQAQFRLYQMYFKGIGTKKNMDSAKHMLIMSANAGYVRAINELIKVLYKDKSDDFLLKTLLSNNEKSLNPESNYIYSMLLNTGRCFNQDLEKSKLYLNKSVCGGYSKAIITYSDILIKSDDLNNRRIAYASCLELAKKGNGPAQFRIAKMYYFGKGTKKDFEQYSYWLNEAIRNENENAKAWVFTHKVEQ